MRVADMQSIEVIETAVQLELGLTDWELSQLRPFLLVTKPEQMPEEITSEEADLILPVLRAHFARPNNTALFRDKLRASQN